MKLYCIAPQGARRSLLAEAAARQHVQFVGIDSEQCNVLRLSQLQEGDMLFRAVPVHRYPAARSVEARLLHEGVVTFYQSNAQALELTDSLCSHAYHEKAGIPTPRTVWPLTRDRVCLREYVDHVGGFPVIVKVLGSSRGMGVMRVESFPALFSLVDYVLMSGKQGLLREYIDVGKPTCSYRAVVVGGRVVTSYMLSHPEPDEFRSNAGKQQKIREAIDLLPEEEEVLVRAVRVMGFELGAVDFVRRRGVPGDLAIFEVNFPFDFVPAIRQLDTTLVDEMLSHLLEKRTVLLAEKRAVGV